MAKGIVLVELDLERHVIRKLKEAESLMAPGLGNATAVIELILTAHSELKKLYSLEYRENASQNWKKWEMQELKEAMFHISTVAKAIHAGIKNVKQLMELLNKAIALVEKLLKYELRIGG